MKFYKGEITLGKDIAVLMGNISMDNQKLILDGMIDVIKETDSNLFVFTNHTTRRDKKDSIQGAYQIMELPDFEYFDGVVVAPDTITYTPIASFVVDKIRASKKPAVTLERELDGFGCLKTSNFDAQFKIVEHLIVEHNCKDIVYIRGFANYKESGARFEGYCAALEKYEIPFREEYVFDGMFTLESGISAVMEMEQAGIKPQAIVCANDMMAIGVLEYFKKKGVRVPEDILLAGFDNSESAQYSTPVLSSVDKNPYELGKRAICEILTAIEGKEQEEVFIESRLHNRATCGCKDCNKIDVGLLKYKYMQQNIYASHMSELINGTMADFSGAHKPEDVLPVLEKSIHRTGLKEFYLCLCEKEKVFVLPEGNMGGNFDLLQVNKDYTDRIELPFAYSSGNISSFKSFEKGRVLPKEIRETIGGGNYYVVTPVFFQNCCYGYCVSGNDKLALKSNMYYSWLMNIGVAYENIRKWMLLQDAVIRLNNVWSLDMLTQMHNRAGFYYEAKTILEILKLEDSKIFVLFSDVDGLKAINDTYGHEAGDALIKEMAACFKENLTNDMLAMRYGGDEFVVFGSYEDESEVDYLIDGIHRSMEHRNKTGNHVFKLSASIGITKYNAKDVNELSELIDIADAQMYEQKRKKREERERLAKNEN